MKNRLRTLIVVLSFSPIMSAQCLSGDCANGTGIWKDASGIIYKGEFRNGTIQSKIIDWGNNEFYKGKEYLGPLYSAVSQRKQIKMTYTPFGKEPKTFITNPVYLKQYNNRWFVVSLLEKDGFVFVNAFDRIDNLVVLDTEIPKDITFDAEEYFDPIVGVSRPMDGEIEEIEIQFTPDTYPYVKTKPIHHSQKNYDDECKVKIRVIRNRELENELMKYRY